MQSSRAYFSVGAYTCAALHYSHQCKSLHDLVPLMSCSLLQCSITNSCSSLRSFSPHSHPWNHCYALLNQLRISYKSAINQIWAIGYSRHFLWGPIEKQLQEFALQCSQAFLDVALELLCGYLSGWSLSTSHLHSPSTRCIQMSKYHGFTLCKNMQACDLQLCSLYYYTIHVLLSEFFSITLHSPVGD